MRPFRDRLGELIRRSRIDGLIPWDRLTEDGREDFRRSADKMMRLAEEFGLSITAADAPLDIPPPSNPVIWRWPVADGNAERLLRAGKGVWEVVKVEGGQETIQLKFTMQESPLAAENKLMVPAGTKVSRDDIVVAAALMVLQMDALGMEDAKGEAA